MLDAAGYPDVKIMASNAIEEETIKALRDQDACIDIFGIGEKLITASSDAVFGGVYKLVAIEQEDGTIEPKIKISENVEKITTPHFKDLYRFYDKKSGKALADLLTIHGEEIDTSKPYELFDPVYTWKKTVVEDFEVKSLLVPIFKDGICVYPKKTIEEIRAHRETEEERLWDGVKRILHPHKYFVDFSLPLWNLKNDLLTKYSARGR